MATWSITRFVIALTLFSSYVSCRAIMAIDYGEEVKLSLAQKSFSIVKNEASKPSTWGAVAVTKDDIQFSSSARYVAARQPSQVFSQIKYLLGLRHDSTEAKEFQKLHPEYVIVPDTNRTMGCAFKHPSYDVPLAAEELVAFQLDYYRQLVEREAQEPIKECVITVPAYFTDAARRAMMDAAKIAGLTVLELINDVNAGILQYALTLDVDEEPKYYIFTDIGSTATSATLASVNKREMITKMGYDLVVPTVDIIGTEYDSTVGGSSIDRIIFDRLVELFREANPSVVPAFLDDARVRYRLDTESKKIKHILTINSEYKGRIDDLYQGLPLSYHLTQVELNKLTASLVPLIMAPIQRVLSRHNVTVDQLEKGLIVGNGFRPPFILDAIREFLTPQKLSMRISHDEVSALGACFRATQLNPNFSTKSVQYFEKPTYTYEMSNDGSEFSPLFTNTTTLPSTKNVTMKAIQDFTVHFQSRDRMDNIAPVGQVKVTANVTVPADTVGPAKIKVPVTLNGSGILSVGTPLLVYSRPKAGNANETVVTEVPLPKEVSLTYPSLSEDSLAFYRARLANFLALKKARKELSDTRNELESLCYSLRTKLDEEYYGQFVSAEAKGYILKDIKRILEYLDEDMYNLEILLKDLKILKGWMRPVENRMKDYEGRPAAIETLLVKLNTTDDFVVRSMANLASLKLNLTEPIPPLNHTDTAFADLEKLDTQSKDVSSWLKLRREQQDTLPTWETAILLVKDIDTKGQNLDKDRIKASGIVKKAVTELKKILSPPPPPPTPPTPPTPVAEPVAEPDTKPPSKPEEAAVPEETVTGPPERLEL